MGSWGREDMVWWQRGASDQEVAAAAGGMGGPILGKPGE